MVGSQSPTRGTTRAYQWFAAQRRRLRQGQADVVLDDIAQALVLADLPATARHPFAGVTDQRVHSNNTVGQPPKGYRLVTFQLGEEYALRPTWGSHFEIAGKSLASGTDFPLFEAHPERVHLNSTPEPKGHPILCAAHSRLVVTLAQTAVCGLRIRPAGLGWITRPTPSRSPRSRSATRSSRDGRSSTTSLS